MSDPASGGAAPRPPAEAQQRLAEGLELHRRGALQQADVLYREAMRLGATADALHLRGLVAHQLGRHADGEQLIRAAIEQAPSNCAFLNNLGETLRAQGRMEEAIQAYQDALAIDPRFPDAPGNLALALASAGRFQEALPHAERACQLSGGSFEPFMVHGELLRQLSRFEEAVAAYDEALRRRSDLLEAWVNSGLSLLMLDRNQPACEYFRRALALDPRSPQAATGLGLALLALRELDAAQESFDAALRAAPEYPDALVGLARLRRSQHRHREAVELGRRALGRDPRVQGAHAVIGSALRSLGQFAEAVSSLEQAARENPLDTEPLCALAYLRERLIPRRALLEQLETLLQRPEYGARERAELHFAAGTLRDEEGEHRAAFAHVRGGNRLVRTSLHFDVGQFADLVDALIETVSAEFLSERRAFALESSAPIFIFGMPRSGTTLTEQVLSMHAAVSGAGEVGVARLLPVGERDYPAWLEGLDAGQAQVLGTRYLERLCTGAGPAGRVTDKMPANFLHLGLLSLLFPHAPLVHCRRDPRDTCLSIYMQSFAHPEGHPYAYDLGELGRYYREYLRLTSHWHDVLGPRMHTVHYERLVQNPEPEIRALVSHCALDWDPRCLHHTENRRPVTTLSAWQARQPIYRTSIGRWRKFEDDLRELADALGDDDRERTDSPRSG